MITLNDKCELLLARRAFVKNISVLLASLMVPGFAFASKSPKAQKSEDDKNHQVSKSAHVTEIRHWSNPVYSRISITLDRETSYKHSMLNHSLESKTSPHIHIDINNAGLPAGLTDIPIGNDLLKSVRISKLNSNRVRLEIDIEDLKKYEIFTFYDPFRIILDIHAERRAEISKHEDSIHNRHHGADEKKPEPGKDKSKQAKLKPGKIRRIVIDPGHGGKDPGAVGVKGIMEKDVALAIGTKLADKIRQELGIDVVMTRTTDVFIPLQERTSIANKVGADLFISIHANASPNRNTAGIESYYLNLAKTEKAAQLAAQENGTSLEKVSTLQAILFDLMANYKLNDSAHLADEVQKALYKKVSSKYQGSRNLGVKQGPFFVLVGATMPSILVETAFLSNEMEEARLSDPQYQDTTADGILKGLDKYISSLKS
ncbi:MAG: N-acetylmuramoyl-L-alanine amidase [Geobacteraceae bacterium]|nr:N-acetylmuramoyl-L-alanine amidase [Geobacteraceae bacterium]